jgi:TRAP-type C4-dicarboxylate transport system permease large subunit
MTGMARAMIQFLASLLGHVRGGLSYVLIGAMYLVSGISGSKIADMAAIAPVLFPEMKKRGAKPGDLVALLSATGAQTETIPPSHRADHHRLGHGRVDRRALHRRHAAGAGARRWRCACGVVALPQGRPERRRSAKASAQIGVCSRVALPALALPFVIRAAVVEGVATATEVSTIGIVYAVLIGLLVYRQFDWRRLGRCWSRRRRSRARSCSSSAAPRPWPGALTQSGFSQDLAQLDGAMPGGAYGFLAVSIVAFVVLGSVLEGIPAIVLFGPLLFPIARRPACTKCTTRWS